MAAIDKIYVRSYEQFKEFKEWCEKQPPIIDKYGKKAKLTQFIIGHWTNFDDFRPIFQAPYYVDAYLIRNCPFEYIQNELKTNYGEWTQDQIDEAYDIVMKRGGTTVEPGTFYYWLSKDDFEIIDGVITMINQESSDYQLIKEGKKFTKPFEEREYGTHFKCIQHPNIKYNRPFKGKWMIQVDALMWYNTRTWDYWDDFVISDWTSDTAHCNTIRALKRKLCKWKLPVGTIVTVTGRYVEETYKFKITK